MLVPSLEECKEIVRWWILEENVLAGVSRQLPTYLFSSRMHLDWLGSASASERANIGWGVVSSSVRRADIPGNECFLMPCTTFKERNFGQAILLMADSATVVAYIKKQGMG